MDTSSPISPSSPNALAVIPGPESAYAKMKKIISSPRGKRRAVATSTMKTFGVPLEEILARDSTENGVPYIVHKMCQYVLKNGMTVEGIFRVNANLKTVEKLKASIDKNGDADLEEANDVMAVASLLKMFLRELPDSVIPDNMQPGFIKAQSLREDKEQHLLILRYLVQKMPYQHFDLLKYLIEFLTKIAENSETNKMTSVALAVVFGPNIFKCSESLQGLKEQACVNAITCKLIEQYEFLFMTGNKENEETQNESVSSTGENSPRKKPARPPPPKFTQAIVSPRKGHSDENSNMVDDSYTPEDSPRIDPVRNRSKVIINGPQENKTSNKSVTIVFPEPNRSSSPPKTYRSLSTPPMASPSSKQIVDNTVHDAVKEHLFGMGLVTSSSESDTQGYEPLNSPLQNLAGDEARKSMKNDCEKFSSAREQPESNQRSPRAGTEKRFKLKRMIKYSAPDEESMTDDVNEVKLQPSPSNGTSVKIDVESLNELEAQWKGPLASLTSNRVAPPRNRKQMTTTRRSKSENIDELIKNRENEKKGDENNDGVRLSQSTKNPLLISIRNDKVSRLAETSVVDRSVKKDENDSEMIETPDLHSGSKDVASPRTGKINKLARSQSYDAETREKPVVPPLDLVRIQSENQTDAETRFSPKERFAHILSDSPVRSPRSFPSDAEFGGDQNIHRQQIFLEKKQDTVPILDMSAKDLKKRIESLRKIITNFETSFEAEHQRMPKPSEKGYVQKYIAELGRAKKQLKELMSTMKENPDRGEGSQAGPEVGFAPNMRDLKLRNGKPTKEDTLALLLKKQSEKRLAAGRPEEIEGMSMEQLKEEKLAVQKALLQYENLHGRPTSKEDKTLMRPIYERYRRIKRLIASNKDDVNPLSGNLENSKDPGKMQDSIDAKAKNLRPIIEGEPISNSLNNSSKQDDSVSNEVNKEDELNDTFNITRKPPDLSDKTANKDNQKINEEWQTVPATTSKAGNESAMNESVLHDATLDELLRQQKIAKKSKKILGKKLKDYEDSFFIDTGRKVQKEDRSPYEAEYSEYKRIKARLRLLEALITKKKANQTV